MANRFVGRAIRPWGAELSALLLAAVTIGAASPQTETEKASDGVLAPQAIEVSWDDVLRSVERHPRLAARKYEIEAARGAVDAASAVPNPSLEATVGRARAPAGGDSKREWGVAATLPLTWLIERGPKIDAADAEVARAEAEWRRMRRELLSDLGTRFWRLVEAQARLSTAEALEGQTANLTRVVQRRVENGAARPIELTRIEIELDRVRGELDVARTAHAARRTELALCLGGEWSRPIVAVADLDVLPDAPALAGADGRDWSDHPSNVAAEAEARALAARAASETRARFPSVSISAYREHELDRLGDGLRGELELPLWNWNSGRVAEARALSLAGRQRSQAEALTLEVTAVELLAACQSALRSAARIKTRILPRAQAAADTTERMYAIGEVSLLEVIDNRRTSLDLQREYLTAFVEAQTECNRFSLLFGKDPQ